MKILCLCLSATIQRTLSFENFELNKVNRTSVFREDASGKALNSARVLNQIEKNCAVAFCPLGTENEARFMELAKRDEIEVHAIHFPGKVRECWTILSDNGSTTEIVADENADSEIEQFEIEKIELEFLKNFKSEIKNYDALLFAGSTPSLWHKRLNQKICEIAKNENKFILADFCGEALISTLENPKSIPDVIKINLKEKEKTFGGEDILSLSKKYGCTFVITRGKESTIAAHNGEFYEWETENVEVVNTTACGDSFDAGFLFEFLATNDFERALKKGTNCAARNAKSIVPGSIK